MKQFHPRPLGALVGTTWNPHRRTNRGVQPTSSMRTHPASLTSTGTVTTPVWTVDPTSGSRKGRRVPRLTRGTDGPEDKGSSQGDLRSKAVSSLALPSRWSGATERGVRTRSPEDRTPSLSPVSGGTGTPDLTTPSLSLTPCGGPVRDSRLHYRLKDAPVTVRGAEVSVSTYTARACCGRGSCPSASSSGRSSLGSCA